MFFSLYFPFIGVAGGLNKQIWHVKWVSNVARSLHEWPSTERPDHRCTYQVSLLLMKLHTIQHRVNGISLKCNELAMY